MVAPKWYRNETKKISLFENYQEMYRNPQKFDDEINKKIRENAGLTFDVYIDPNNKDNYYTDIHEYKKRDVKAFAYAFLAVFLIVAIGASLITAFLSQN
jgi:hypothetical protein